MADTGAPWNIPYVENADLVKDYPTASLALANAIDAGLDAASAPGIIVGFEVVNLTGSFSTTSTSYTDITGLTITYTPTDTNNRILVTTSITYDHTVISQFLDFRHYDGVSQIGQMWRMVPRDNTEAYDLTWQNNYAAASTSSTTFASQVLINNSGTLNIANGSMTLIEYAP